MKKSFRLKKLAIVGLGLMGGSLGMAVRQNRLAETVSGFARKPKIRRQALARGVVDEAPATIARAVSDADMVLLCVPVNRIMSLAKACLPFLSDACVVTDVGSSKSGIVALLDPVFSKTSAAFVGGHPIAGSERQGLNAACKDLYENASVILTPTRKTDRKALRIVKEFWSALGARVKLASPLEHDRMIARTSHLPHLAASMLASHVGRRGADGLRDFCGTGFLDTTRIAEGDPDLWTEIIRSNAPAIVKEWTAFEKEFRKVKSLIGKNDFTALRRYLAVGRNRRRKLVRGR